MSHQLVAEYFRDTVDQRFNADPDFVMSFRAGKRNLQVLHLLDVSVGTDTRLSSAGMGPYPYFYKAVDQDKNSAKTYGAFIFNSMVLLRREGSGEVYPIRAVSRHYYNHYPHQNQQRIVREEKLAPKAKLQLETLSGYLLLKAQNAGSLELSEEALLHNTLQNDLLYLASLKATLPADADPMIPPNRRA